MKIVVLANEFQKAEILAQSGQTPLGVEWEKQLTASINCNSLIDLLFEPTPSRIALLQKCNATLIVINDVEGVLKELPSNFVRINGWPGFLKRELVEAATLNEDNKIVATSIFEKFNKKTEWVPSIEGLITPRIVSMIINEAYFALEENVSTKAETDIAMKLGTNYPFGPFEWAQLIGLPKIYSLLKALTVSNSQYTPCKLLEQEALSL
ncbi:MAG: 3-hydroxyacyl-CoA dehydrogenase family protein [Chitinophagaceae bacterium]